VPLRELDEQIGIARDQPGLADDANAKPDVRAKYLEECARQSDAPFRGLIRIGRRPDHDELAVQSGAWQHGGEELRGALFHNDAPLKRDGRREGTDFIEGGRTALCLERPLDGPAMGVARVTVRAAELATDVRVDRPIAHPRDCRRVQDSTRRHCQVSRDHAVGSAIGPRGQFFPGRIPGGGDIIHICPYRRYPEYNGLTTPFSAGNFQRS
jgi:hypothetical protein